MWLLKNERRAAEPERGGESSSRVSRQEERTKYQQRAEHGPNDDMMILYTSERDEKEVAIH